jgi:hypothetical protein
MMKVAFLGNMNNNAFSMMRYFHDLGVDAHLLLYTNDGAGSLSHFGPEADTWEVEKWRPYIHQTAITNGYAALLPHPGGRTLPPTRRYLNQLFSDYDRIVGCGIAPALLNRIGRQIDIFYPYGTGVEFVGSMPDRRALRSRSYYRRALTRYVKRKQVQGLARARHCFNAEMSLTKQTFDEIGVPFEPLAIPMVYNREQGSALNASAITSEALVRIASSNFSILSHSRLMWVYDCQYSPEVWDKRSKHNDWLLTGFSQFLKVTNETSPLLVLFEYGPDIVQTKALCDDLGISEHVLWLPKLPRKEILLLLNHVDVGVGEFSTDRRTIWGGTGWEVLASGKPLLQSLNFTEGEYVENFGHPPPPILHVDSSDTIREHLCHASEAPSELQRVGDQSKKWFNEHNGIRLAVRWLEALTTAS